MKTLVVQLNDLDELLSMKECVELEERAFRAYGQGKVVFTGRTRLAIQGSGRTSYTSGYVQPERALSSRVTASFQDNPSRNISKSLRLSILYEDDSGFPLAIMDGTYVMAMSRGATAALSAQFLSRKSSRVAILGSGLLAKTCLYAMRAVTNMTRVAVFSRTTQHREKFAQSMSESLGLDVIAVDSAREAVKEAEIIIAATSATQQLVSEDDISQGTHIVSVGGGKEIDRNILRKARIVVDSYELLNDQGRDEPTFVGSALKDGIISRENVFAHLGEIIAGSKSGRISNEEITVFDNPGLPIQDSMIALAVYRKAKEKGVGKELNIIDTSPSFLI